MGGSVGAAAYHDEKHGAARSLLAPANQSSALTLTTRAVGT